MISFIKRTEDDGTAEEQNSKTAKSKIVAHKNIFFFLIGLLLCIKI